MRTTRTSAWTASAALVVASFALTGADWPRFRGPHGSGVSEATGFPTHWSEKEGTAWKAPLPGPGSSSPILAGNRIFVTCYSGYGASQEDPGRLEDLRRHVICIDAENGEVLWDRSIESKLPEQEFRGIGIPNHGYASASPVTDGERVYAYFGRSGVVAYDVKGEELWRAEVDPDPRTHGFGTASSPILWKDLVIVPAGIECEAILAFDKKTGKQAWKSPADGYGSFWGTPIIVGEGDDQELVISVPEELWGLNPENGKLRWYTPAIPDSNICTSPIVAGGVIYAVGGRRGGSVAVKPGGKGDVSESNVLWRNNLGSYVPSPVYYEKHLYWVNDRGIAHCVEAQSGKEVFRERIPDAGSVSIYSSLLAADGKLYCVSRRSGTFVLAAEPELRVLAHNTIKSDESDFNASAVPGEKCIYLRSDRFLYKVTGKSD